MFYRFSPDGRQKTIDLKDLYRGSVFICGSHPSFSSLDVSLFNRPGISTLALNNVATVMSPTLWVGADKPNCYANSILFDPSIIKFTKVEYIHEPIGDKQWRQLPSTIFYRLIGEFIDCNKILYDRPGLLWPKNVFMIAIQLAYKLGFRKIYFCGVGLEISKDNQYCYGSSLTDSQVDYNQRTYNSAFHQFTSSLNHMREFGLTFISCTPGSKMNSIIEYVPFEQAIDLELLRTNNNLIHSSVYNKDMI